MKLYYELENVIKLKDLKLKFNLIKGGRSSGKTLEIEKNRVMLHLKNILNDIGIKAEDVTDIDSLMKISNCSYGKNLEHLVVFEGDIKAKSQHFRIRFTMLGKKLLNKNVVKILFAHQLIDNGVEVDSLVFDEFEYHDDDPTELKECKK